MEGACMEGACVDALRGQQAIDAPDPKSVLEGNGLPPRACGHDQPPALTGSGNPALSGIRRHRALFRRT
jgi:hypothetical protein